MVPLEGVNVKRMILLTVCLLGIAGSASAYQIYLSCPESVQAGLPLNCSVDSNLPTGTEFDVVFYQSVYIAQPFSRMSFTIQADHPTMHLSLDTKGLTGGQYKVEIRFSGPEEGKLSSDSVTMQVPKLIDRSGDLTITSPLTQTFGEALRIEGSMKNLGNKGIDMEVRGSDGLVFGPQFTDTKVDFRSGAGVFTRRVAVTTPGRYDVYFSDIDGYIGVTSFTVLPAGSQVPTVVPSATLTGTQPAATVPSLPPTTPKSPLSLFVVIATLSMLVLLSGGIRKYR